LREKFKISFIGHCHTPAAIRKNVISVGAPLQHNFGDCGEKRGWWIYDFDKDNLEYIENLESPRFYDLHIKRGDEKIPGRPDKDFYRIRVETENLPSSISDIVWKRVSCEVTVGKKKRANISIEDKIEDIIAKYVETKSPNLDRKKLIDLGRRYLQ